MTSHFPLFSTIPWDRFLLHRNRLKKKKKGKIKKKEKKEKMKEKRKKRGQREKDKNMLKKFTRDLTEYLHLKLYNLYEVIYVI